MGTEENNFNRGGNTQPVNNGSGNIQHNDTHTINESAHRTGRIQETDVTQNPPKPRRN